MAVTFNEYIDDWHIQLRCGDKFVLTMSKDKCSDNGCLRTTLIFDTMLSIECIRNDEHSPTYDAYASPRGSPQFAFDVTYVVVHNNVEKDITTFFRHQSYACEFHDFLVAHCT